MLYKEKLAFLKRTTKSFETFQKASKNIPMGVNSNIRYIPPYPLYVDRALSSRLWDADGNEYLDYQLGFGVLMTGHNHPKLVEAVKARLDKGGIAYGAEPIDSHEVAEELTKRFKLDMVRFQCSGTAATSWAVRIARAYTGKEKVIKFEGHYHGTNDYLFVSYYPPLAPAKPMRIPHCLGMPEGAWKETLVARFNDLNSVEEILQKDSDDIACIILEPVAMNMGVIPPEKGFLEGLRKLSDEYGVLLIFDEVKTGAKLAYGGATEYFNIIPDIVTVGKAIGGGFPISAVIGRRDVLELVGPGKVVHAGTFNANHICITAAKVVLKEILTPEVYGSARSLSKRLAEGYAQILDDAGIEARVTNVGVNGHIYPGVSEVKDYRGYLQQDSEIWWSWAYAMMNRGIIFEVLSADDQWTISVQHTERDVERTLETFMEVVKS
ncbi:MAG: aspartate aminotransferase family protein [Candidatus Bathyarchaeota archaeon]|nr:MAG: aspartate aminotransferase family protein [Candidatus Bathyarchaeota archaeon]